MKDLKQISTTHTILGSSVNSILESISKYAELGKIRITFFVGITTLLGSVLYSGNFSVSSSLVSLGVFFLAVGSSSINQIQEWKLDLKMKRTQNRPLPSGNITFMNAVLFAAISSLIGSFIIFSFGNLTALILALTAMFWYNLIYTPLKRRTSLAVFPGAVIGAIPPIVGWTAMGGNAADQIIIVIALFLFIWQIPHFWLLYLIFADDYSSAGFPILRNYFSDFTVSKLTFFWTGALAGGGLSIAFFTSTDAFFSSAILLLLGIWLVIKSKGLLIEENRNKSEYRKAFMNINSYVLIVTILLFVDKLVF